MYPDSISFEDIEEEMQDDESLRLRQDAEDLSRGDDDDPVEDDTEETEDLFDPDEEDLTAPEEDIF